VSDVLLAGFANLTFMSLIGNYESATNELFINVFIMLSERPKEWVNQRYIGHVK
jgi:hypothetical protein